MTWKSGILPKGEKITFASYVAMCNVKLKFLSSCLCLLWPSNLSCNKYGLRSSRGILSCKDFNYLMLRVKNKTSNRKFLTTTLRLAKGVSLQMLCAIWLFLGIATGSSLAEETCSYLPKNKLAFTFSKRKLEDILSDVIVTQFEKNNLIDWEGMTDCFQSLGKNYSVEFIPARGSHKSETIRFTIDRSSIWPIFLRVPGGSNGVFTAIFQISSPEEVAVIRRGGIPQWLRLE
ncbi:hypothetical protein [Roseibium sp. SCP14]|uniref:hypothetical protein n=1 Tax=Roseibium sp. SCP14 TaxID=3141375 RepID=UPI0033360F49